MQKLTQKLNVAVVVTGFVGLLVFCLPTVSNAETIILNATEDSGMLDGDDTNDPFPGILYSELDTREEGDIWLSILKFDLSSLVGVEIKSATFELTSNFNHSSDTFIHEVFSSSDDNWTENIVTGVNRPLNSTMTLQDSTGIGGVSQTYSWNVIAGVTGGDGLAGINNLLTLIVMPQLSQAGNAFGPHFNDSDSSSGFPRLIINAANEAVQPGDGPLSLSGRIETEEGIGICAMVLASGEFQFSCNPNGPFELNDLPQESNGSVKRQVYVHGFFPNIDVLQGSKNEVVVMQKAGACPEYNILYNPSNNPGSAGDRINISGRILLQNSNTPVCAMVLANGEFQFSCDGTGNYSLNIPLDGNGQFKLQVYADGFAPKVQTFDEFMRVNDARLARASECN
jgi:hypothetical protein